MKDHSNQIKNSISYIEKSPNLPLDFNIQPYNGINKTNEDLNHFVIFLKPESLNYYKEINNEALLQLIFSILEKFDVAVGGIKLLSGHYLRQHLIIDQNYKILNNISVNGLKGCSETISKKAFGLIEDKDTEIYGGHQFLENHKAFNAYSLCALSHNLETTKLGSGAYGVKAHMFGQNYLLLNAFHPYQIENLTLPGTAILALECFSTLSINDLRFKVVGDIFPENAKSGSIRREIYNAQQELKLPQVNIQYNYVHISPGPLEGIFQLIHFFSDHEKKNYIEYTSTNMGLLLKEKLGLTSQQVISLENNPEFIISGNQLPILDQVENLSTKETLNFITSIKEQIIHG